METILSPGVILSLGSGFAVMLITQIIKKTKIAEQVDTQLLVVFLSVLAGGIYQAFKIFVPVEMRDSFVNFVVSALSTSVFVYEFLWKRFVTPEVKPLTPEIPEESALVEPEVKVDEV